MKPRGWWIAVLGAAAVVAMVFVPPIAQDPAYHDFADRRRMLGLPNTLDVVSNAGFVVVGILGLLFLRRPGAPRSRYERRASAVLFAGLLVTAAGSVYYHWAPDDATLFWDRLPMTLLFMSMFALVLGDRIGERAGERWLVPLLVAGAASIVYWRWTGDLRFYAVIQFFPFLAVLLLLALFPPRYDRSADWVVLIGWYALAKVCEVLDRPVFALGGWVSGHSLKHLTAALAAWWLLRMLQLRRPLDPVAPH